MGDAGVSGEDTTFLFLSAEGAGRTSGVGGDSIIADQQVGRAHYFSSAYNSQIRWTSFARQYQLVRDNVVTGSDVLEIGPGNKIITHQLEEAGYTVTTVDIADDLDPDVTADVCNLPFEDNRFDAVCIFEVLEHLPFEDVEAALAELQRVTRGPVFLSVPHKTRDIGFGVFLPKLAWVTTQLSLPLHRFRTKSREEGEQHYWEIGWKQTPRNQVETVFTRYFSIEETFRNRFKPYHRFYVLAPSHGGGC